MNKSELNKQEMNSVIQGTNGEGLLSFVTDGGDLSIKEKGLVRKENGQVVSLTELADKVLNIPLTPTEFETTIAMMSLDTDKYLHEDYNSEVQEFSLAGMNDMMFTNESILLTNLVWSFDLPDVTLYDAYISNEAMREFSNLERNLLKIVSYSKVKQENIKVVGKFTGVTTEVEHTVESLYAQFQKEGTPLNIKTQQELSDMETFHYNLARAILKNRFTDKSIIDFDVFRSGKTLIKVTGLRVLVEEIVDEFEKVRNVEVTPTGLETGRVNTSKENEGAKPKEG